MRAVQTAIAVAVVVMCAPAVAAAALVTLLQDIAARRRTLREQPWLNETKDQS